MPEYDLSFARKLTETASLLAAQGLTSLEARRVVLYLGLLATEIGIKAMLEQAGEPVAKIRKHSHNLRALTRELGKCEVDIELAAGVWKPVSAARIRAIEIGDASGAVTVGKVLEAEAHGASTYPNQIRYGPLLRHFPAEVVVRMATDVVAFAEKHWSTIRK